MNEHRLIKTDKECRMALKRGVDAVADVVKKTLGPYGRNVIIERKKKVPRITNDGVSVASEIVLKDETEDVGAQAVIDAAIKTNEQVGDGTTTSIVLAQAVFEEVINRLDEKNSILSSSCNLLDLKRKIDKSCKEVVKKLIKSSKQIKTKEDLDNVAITSIEDEEMGKIVSNMVWTIGKDGFVNVEDSFLQETETDIIKGMKFFGKYAAPFMITNSKKQAVFRAVSVLVTNEPLEDPNNLKGIAEQVAQRGRPELVVFAPLFSVETLSSIFNTHKQANFRILAIKVASATPEQLEDLACYVGANFIDKDKEMSVESASFNDLGYAQRIIATDDETIVIGGKGEQKDINARIKEIKSHLVLETLPEFKKNIERRIASLSGGVGVIKVGAKSEVERGYIRLKVEDGVCATKAALQEGVVKGGGLALKEIADKLPKGDILKNALSKPYEQIQENAGGKLEIGNVLDPVKVVRIALENACSLASTLATTESSIVWKRPELAEDVHEAVKRWKALGPDEMR